VSDDITGLWDKMRLEQVFSNLLSNAVKYAPGTPIEITARGNADLVEITVRDQGPGISKANQATLFERFERAGASRNLSGLGLGLFISKHIVETLGGTIRIESAEGHGAALIINLPLNIQHESRVGSA
jgi:signal transduction histidine kinase